MSVLRQSRIYPKWKVGEGMSTQAKPWDEWLDDLRALTAEYGFEYDVVADTGEECWRDSYENGCTPEEAWDEGMSE